MRPRTPLFGSISYFSGQKGFDLVAAIGEDLLSRDLQYVVLGLGEFFTERVIGGAQNPMLAGLVLRQVDIFQWASASAMAVLLTLMTLVTVSIMLRFFDLKKI